MHAAGDAASDLTVALTEFLAQPNYSWGASTSTGIPEGRDPNVAEAIEGQHETNGYTKAWFLTGPHIPAEEWPALQAWAGITDADSFFSSRWVFETPEGWVHLNKLPVAIPAAVTAAQNSTTSPSPFPINNRFPFPVPRQEPALQTTTHPKPLFGIGFVHRLFGFSRPDSEVAIMVENLERVVETTPGEFAAVLTTEGADRLVNPAIPTVIKLVLPWRIENVHVSVKVVLRKGNLTGYEISTSGIIVFLTQRFPLHYTKARNITDVGTTVIDVPAEVASRLGR